MHRLLLLVVLFVAFASQLVASEVTLNLSTARLTLDEQGCVRSFVFADGAPWPDTTQPAFRLHTVHGTFEPKALKSQADALTITFADGSVAEFAVHCNPGFALFRLNRLDCRSTPESFELFSLPVPPGAEVSEILNAAAHGSHRVALMAAEPNVEPLSGSTGTRVDRAGCSHQFTRTAEARSGQNAARFTATCNDHEGGWSMQGMALPNRLDLSGCKAIRAWVHGDGQGEALKIQLYDGIGGYRDDYATIDFQGWKEITFARPALDTLDYSRVSSLNFYYNALPASRTVRCLLDRVEAVVQRGGKQEIIPLEDFESPDSPLWSDGKVMLKVRTLKAHGIGPAAFGLLAGPQGEFFPTVERFEKAAGLPSPQLGGVWNKRSPWIKRSYYFLTDFSERQYDDALEIARRGGFDMILILQDSWTKSTGHYEVNRNNFPDGLQGLKRTVDRFKKAGFKVGFHTLGASIYPPDPYLTPIPDSRLVKDAFVPLAADIDEKSDFVPTAEPPTAFPGNDGGYMGKGTMLVLGNELISYGSRSLEPPFGFRQCRRGQLGTKAASHSKSEKISHLLRSYGYYLFDMDTSLIDEVASNFARVANACGIDMIYFDGSELLQGDHWYYNAKLHKTFFDKLQNKNVLLQASSSSHYSWHAMARNASADGHGDLKGYLDERSPAFDYFARNGMPLDIGWYYAYDASSTPDMYEYILGATIGYDSSMSFQVSPAAAKRHPFIGDILDLIARYEKLRLSGRVPAEMRQRLRIDPLLGGEKTPADREKLADLRREYRLLDSPRGQVFQRVAFSPWREFSGTDPANNWPVDIRQGPARVGIQIQAMTGPWLAAGPSYNSPGAIVLETFDDLAPYTGDSKRKEVFSIGPGEAGAVLPGVSQRLESTDHDARVGRRCAVYTAGSTLSDAGGWALFGKEFASPLDLSRSKGVGFWLRGDGHGGLFKLQLCDAKGALDYYINNDFTGWRYQQLAWPPKPPIDFHDVRRLLFYYNGLPARSTVACGIDDVKALPGLDAQRLTDPWLEVAGKRFQWRGTLAEGQYLLFWPGESLTRYGAPLAGPERLPVPPESWELPTGSYNVRFGSTGQSCLPVRVRLSLQPPERHAIP